MGRRDPVSTNGSAADGSNVILGTTNSATAPTEIVNSGIPGVAMRLQGNDVPGVEAYSLEITGPLGHYAGTGLHAVGTLRGVMGEARQANAGFSDGIGVQGVSAAGEGVRGTATAVSGTGVRGTANHEFGTGVSAENDNPGGVALSVQGRAMFTRSGTATVLAGESSVKKGGVEVRNETLILAVLRDNRPGVWVRAVVPHPAGSAFTVWLNKPVPSNTKVSWFAVN
jgi:hypothetical protein